MANTASAKKMVRKLARRTAVKKSRRSRVRTFIKKVDAAIGVGDSGKAREALVKAESEMMRAVNKGVFHKNTASRKISRMSARVKAMSA